MTRRYNVSALREALSLMVAAAPRCNSSAFMYVVCVCVCVCVYVCVCVCACCVCAVDHGFLLPKGLDACDLHSLSHLSS
jgi:hypothetical protein